MIDHLANRLEQFSCIAFFPPTLPYQAVCTSLHDSLKGWKVWRKRHAEEENAPGAAVTDRTRQNNFVNKT